MRRSVASVFGAVVLAAYPVVAQMPEQKGSGSRSESELAAAQYKKARSAAVAGAQIRHAMRDTVNSGLIGIVSGSMDATDLGKATDLALGLETEGGRLRPLLIAGKGGFLNVTDIVFARGVDMGIVQSDVLTALKRDPPFPGIENYLQYITKLYDEEVHILAGKEINSIEELASKKVNFGMPDSGTHMTAEAIFGTLGIAVEPTSLPQPVALEKLRRGEISALVCVVSKPDRWFKNIRSDENLHFLSVPQTNELRERYAPASLRAEDYPELIDTDKPVSTVAGGNVLAVYNWPPGTERHRRVARFVLTFFDRLHELQSAPYHPKWREINLAAPVPGWTRFATAQEWIRKAGLDTSKPVRSARSNEPVAEQEAAALSPVERNALFTEFAAYQKRLPDRLNSAGLLDPREREALFAEFVAYQKRQAYSEGSVRRRDAWHQNARYAATTN
jgi:uncharacterized protein